MRVSSSAFADGSPIPGAHATPRAGGANVSVPLAWADAPADTVSFAIEVVDLDANLWVHWLVTGIPAGATRIAAGASGAGMPPGARELGNTFGQRGWGGPQPPSGEHRYRFTVYALDVPDVPVPDDAPLDAFRAAARPHVMAADSITGTFRR